MTAPICNLDNVHPIPEYVRCRVADSGMHRQLGGYILSVPENCFLSTGEFCPNGRYRHVTRPYWWESADPNGSCLSPSLMQSAIEESPITVGCQQIHRSGYFPRCSVESYIHCASDLFVCLFLYQFPSSPDNVFIRPNVSNRIPERIFPFENSLSNKYSAGSINVIHKLLIECCQFLFG